ncbi:amidohydrolase family protein [Aliikangiella sp. IMCC44359]|uniref:amidohydrolase family protein n=1 Tax=Aliikangiella sp. IMCC44359 TaxID=3459125 RepID=UPI00403AA34B
MKHLIFVLVAVLFCHFSYAEQANPKDEKTKWDVNNPPGEKYQANIDVTEGTWMNVAVSPDGKTLVFDLLGDLYSLPIKGGKAKALTHSIAWEMQPQFSPDGKQIAFTSDAGGGDNIWIMNSDGTNSRQITKESFRLLNSPSWSPDGQYIAARKHFTSRRSLGAGEIWLYHIAGGKGLQLNKRPNDQKDLGEPVFSPKGEKVYFSRDSTPGKYFEYSKDSNQTIYEIFSINRQNGKIHKEVSGFGGSVRPTPSPDGKYLAFVRRIRNQSSIFLKDLQTGKEFPIYQKLDRDMQETWAIHGVHPTLAWTPDSQDLVFWAGGKIHRLNTTTQVASEIPFHVKTTKSMRKAVSHQVNPAQDKFETKMLRWIQVSPKGNQVIFQALGQLYSRNLPNGKPKRLTKAEDEFEFYPSFSSDGKWVVYSTWNDIQQGAVKKVRAKGGRGSSLTKQPGKYISPRFSSDGESVVYQKITGGTITTPVYNNDPGVYLINSKGGKARLITTSGSSPFFSKDGKRIFLSRSADKSTVLASVDLNGKDPITHASSKFATEFSLSPNEQYLAFRERYQLYVTPFTNAAKAIELSPKASNLPVLKVSTDGGQYISWSSNSQNIHWSLGSSLYSLKLPSPVKWKELAKELSPQINNLGFTVNSDQPRGNTLLTGAQIITMNGDQVIAQGDILINGNRIKAIGKTGEIKVPDNTKQIDVRGKTIIPGIIDVHWHGRQGRSQLTPQQNWYNLATLAFGVTTIHDPSNNTAEIFSAAELARTGKLVAPRIFSTGTILYGAEHFFTAEINSLEDATKHLKRLNSQGAFSVKSYNQPRRDQRQQVLEAARQTQMMVMPEGGSTFQHNLTMIVDGHTGIEHAIPPAKIYQDVKQLWSQSQTGYTPTLVVAYGGIWGENYWYQHNEVWKHPILSKYVPKKVLYPRSIRRTIAPEEDYNHFNVATVAAELQAIGVNVQLGAHGQREGLGSHWEMWMFAQGGMKPLDVIRAATLDGAKYLGMEKHIGSLEADKLADLVILDSDPLKNIYQTDQVSMVMINGRLYNSATMNEIGNHPKKRKKLFFE